MEKCKCERCGRIRDVFQWTRFEIKQVNVVKEHPRDENGNTFHVETEDLGEKRGLCEECAVEINKIKYDLANPLTL